jgi:UDP-2,4-diacetamido-2,4,6-trideoxy-beta-L-altropyranose hydrolase
MNVAIRVDASPAIGIGHVMRCLTLADELRDTGAHVRFVSRHLPQYLEDIVRGRGHECVTLTGASRTAPGAGVPHAHWLGTSQEADAGEAIDALADRAWEWLVVDHYAIGAPWHRALRSRARRILVIDDVADREHDCDVLMDQNLYPDMQTRYSGKVPPACTLLLGPHYALLRPRFAGLHDATPLRQAGVRRILVLLGGMDTQNHTEKVVRALASLADRVFDVDVVIGRQHPAADTIHALCDRHGYRCLVQVDDVASLMAAADLAIGASGSTSWERCCLSLPTLCLTHADNQVAIAEGLASAGAIVNLGDGGAMETTGIAQAVRDLLDDPATLLALSAAARRITDGRGTARVVERMRQELAA